jgi:hypothetical protein
MTYSACHPEPAPVSPPGGPGRSVDLEGSVAHGMIESFIERICERVDPVGFRERFGCFFLAIGSVTFLLFAIPIVQAFKKDPAAVPVEWFGAAFFALLVLWAGWKLYTSARKAAESQKPPSLGARIAGRWKSEETKKEK